MCFKWSLEKLHCDATHPIYGIIFSGGAGFVLSKEALKRYLVFSFFVNSPIEYVECRFYRLKYLILRNATLLSLKS